MLYILYIREKESNEKHYNKYLGFRKNTDVMKVLLLSQKHHQIDHNESGLFFGDRGAALVITAFLSLNCSHCVRAFKKLRVILTTDKSVSVHIILVTTENRIINTLHHLKLNGRDDEALDLLETWYDTDSSSRGTIYETFCVPDLDKNSKDISGDNLNLYRRFNISGTPTFLINGYLLPVQYDIEDINYLKEAFR